MAGLSKRAGHLGVADCGRVNHRQKLKGGQRTKRRYCKTTESFESERIWRMGKDKAT